ncbi:hypothetical protein VPH35_091818 [Triticum aestivum]|uniref:Uncharacterized protein n=1 Tax=Triticum aestivum TaxID=4565 RepID=A0A3B6LRK7_WHEAT
MEQCCETDESSESCFHGRPAFHARTNVASRYRLSMNTIRRRFRALHPPLLLGFYSAPCGTAIPAFIPFRSRSDPDLAAALRSSDFLLTRLPEESGEPGWEMNCCRGGYVVLHNQRTSQIAAYNPLTQALHIIPRPPHETCHLINLDVHFIFSEEDQRAFRVVCDRRRRRGRRKLARFSVFSSDSREWQCFPWVDTSTRRQPGDDGGDECMLTFYTDTPLNEPDRLAHDKHKDQAYLVVLNTATLQLYLVVLVDLPPPLKDIDPVGIILGRTRDGRLFLVCIDDYDASKGRLNVWLWRADGDGDGVEKWMPHKIYPLNKFVDFTLCSQECHVMASVVRVVDGFVFLCIEYERDTGCLLSFCLETEKEDSETKVTGDDARDDGPVGTQGTPSVLATSLQSYKEALINNDVAKVTKIEKLLLSIEDENKSLVRKITTLDAELTIARDHVLKISAEFEGQKQRGDGKCGRGNEPITTSLPVELPL